jgi:crossover junction endodeoxyribonuclease RusA
MTHWDLTFQPPTHPLSINAQGNWAKRRRLLTPWHDVTWALARNRRVQVRSFVPVPITVQVVLPFRKAARRDAHNYTGTVVKAVVDGLKDAQIVPDDTPEWVTVLDPEFSIQPDKSEHLTATVRIRPRSTP